MNLDTFIKILILLLLAPYWWPVLKALYADFQGALAEEGGLFGRDPTPRQLAELQERYRDYESPLTSETHEDARARRQGRPMRAPEAPASAANARQPNSPGRASSPGPRRRGF